MSGEEPLPFIPFEAVEHTADLAFIARGRTPAELFTHAADGMVTFLYDRATVLPLEEERIEVTGEDAGPKSIGRGSGFPASVRTVIR